MHVWLQVNFINHFSGCQLCTRQNKEGNYGECEAEFVKSFEYANGIFSKLLKRMPPRDIAHQVQLAATPYCKVTARSACFWLQSSVAALLGQSEFVHLFELPFEHYFWPNWQRHGLQESYYQSDVIV